MNTKYFFQKINILCTQESGYINLTKTLRRIFGGQSILIFFNVLHMISRSDHSDSIKPALNFR